MLIRHVQVIEKVIKHYDIIHIIHNKENEQVVLSEIMSEIDQRSIDITIK